MGNSMFFPRISLSDIEHLREVSPKRRRFSDNPVVYQRRDGRYIASTLFPSINRLFVDETGLSTKEGPYGPFRFLDGSKEIDPAMRWQQERSDLIFLRDMLNCSVALDFNLRAAAEYTNLGSAEHAAKQGRIMKAVEFLCGRCANAIATLSVYRHCDVLCAMPPSPDKKWDLPTEIAALVSTRIGIPNVSDQVRFTKTKKSIKALTLDEKWHALEEGQLIVGSGIRGKRIALIDDKYQSGTTAQFTASKLFDAGATEVNGLFVVKTWRDTDNT
jgi:predicted amidophosphoribosyltransferase